MERKANREGASLTTEPEKGRWLFDKSHGHFGVYCSNCDAKFQLGIGADRYRFCPMCGKPMDLEGRVY